MGRFGETAMWVLVALGRGPASATGLLDAVRDLDGRIGPATLFGALARLERASLVRSTATLAGPRAYRLAEGSQAAVV
jgi:Fe2+ or Zn2+ uptake regulation protein